MIHSSLKSTKGIYFAYLIESIYNTNWTKRFLESNLLITLKICAVQIILLLFLSLLVSSLANVFFFLENHLGFYFF